MALEAGLFFSPPPTLAGVLLKMTLKLSVMQLSISKMCLPSLKQGQCWMWAEPRNAVSLVEFLCSDGPPIPPGGVLGPA